jgi:hypothetical protein
MLQIEPTASSPPGSIHGGAPSAYGRWRLSSEGKVEGTDLEAHIQWLLDLIEPNRAGITLLQTEGVLIDVFCFWESLTGHGGPQFGPDTLRRLGNMQLELGLDIYFST